MCYAYNNFLVMMTFREIPVPIPNTEVKPKCAENTCGLPCWEDRLLPVFLFYINKNEALYKYLFFLHYYLRKISTRTMTRILKYYKQKKALGKPILT